MMNVGIVEALWRYPVKGMAGEHVRASAVGASGVLGDRRWAVRESARSETQSCKRHPLLLQCVASYVKEPVADVIEHVRIQFPDGSETSSEDPEIHARLSKLLGAQVTLERLRPASDADFYRRYNYGEDGWLKDLVATFTREPGEPLPDLSQIPESVKTYTTTPGSFFLVAPLHVVTTATLQQLRAWNSESDCDVRRFRPNVVVKTNSEREGLVEQRWVGQRIAIANLAMDCVMATPRCGAITRAQGALPFDSKLLRTVVKQADQNVGVYGVATSEGVVRVGDDVAVEN